MNAIVLRGDARHLPLPDASVDLIVTSPPYWVQRDYGYDGQLGSEATPAEWLANLIDCTRDWVRVLKPEGSLFVNLGDKFATRYSSQRGRGRAGLNGDDGTRDRSGQNHTGSGEKSLLGLPWRYALACTDQLGLILRRDIVWSKPNGLPESVTDRCRSSHEYLFHLVKQPRYYAAVDEIREPQVQARGFQRDRANSANPGAGPKDDAGLVRKWNPAVMNWNPLGKLPGSVWRMPDDDTVWDIASQPLTVPAHLGVDHFAAFPMELPRRCVLGWSPPGICTRCGEGRRPVSEVGYIRRQNDRPGTRTERNRDNNRNDGAAPFGSSALRQTTITGYECACLPYTDGAEMCPACHCPIPSIHVSTSTTAMRGMRAADHRGEPEAVGHSEPGTQAQSLLLEAVLEPAHSPQQGSDAGMGAHDQGLHSGTDAGPPDGGQDRLRHAAPASDGGTTRPDADSGRGGASPQRQPGGQPAGEPDGDGQAGPRPGVRFNQAPSRRLPLLRSRGSLDAGCPRCGSPPTRPSLVVDPFGGTGTTALVASMHGRTGVSIDRSADYTRLARWRTTDPGERAKALQVPKPPPIPDGMEALF